MRAELTGWAWALACAGLAAVMGLLPTPASAANHRVATTRGMTFTPSTLTIAAGDTVTFTNAGGTHNVQSDRDAVTRFRCANGCDGAGGNGDLSAEPWSATVTFPTAGTVRYYCQAHGGEGGVGMSGMITVTGATPMVRRRSDFNGDGRSDILWRNTSSGANTIWLGAGSGTQMAMTGVTNMTWRIVGVGDYDGNGRSDVLWRNTGNGANTIWLNGSAATQRAVTGVTTQAWTVVGSGDYNGDGRADILWRNTSTGANILWRSALSASQQAVAAAAVAWRAVGSAAPTSSGATARPAPT